MLCCKMFYFFICLHSEFLPVLGPCTRGCASTLAQPWYTHMHTIIAVFSHKYMKKIRRIFWIKVSFDPGGDWAPDLSISGRLFCHLSYCASVDVLLIGRQFVEVRFQYKFTKMLRVGVFILSLNIIVSSVLSFHW